MKIAKAVLLFFLLFIIGFFAFYKLTHPVKSKSEPPVIEDSIKDLHINCDFSHEDLVKGLTVTDDEDGDITDRLIIGEFSDFENKTCSLKYAAFDSDGQYSEISRSVTFDDYQPPRLALSDSLIFYAKSSKNKTFRDVLTAGDMLDGDITDRIQLSGEAIDYTLVGDYYVVVTVDNSLGDSVEYTLPVHVIDDTSSLYINLTKYLVYLSPGEKFNPMSYVAGTSNDRTSGDTVYDLSVASNLIADKPGVYEVVYTLSGEKVSVPLKKILIVIVTQ